MSPTHHALLHTVSTYLTYIKQLLTQAVEEAVSKDSAQWHKYARRLCDIRELSTTLCEVMHWVRYICNPITPNPVHTYIYL